MSVIDRYLSPDDARKKIADRDFKSGDEYHRLCMIYASGSSPYDDFQLTRQVAQVGGKPAEVYPAAQVQAVLSEFVDLVRHHEDSISEDFLSTVAPIIRKAESEIMDYQNDLAIDPGWGSDQGEPDCGNPQYDANGNCVNYYGEVRRD